MANKESKILARSIGRRKEAVAQIQLIEGSGQFIINNKPAQNYLHNNACSLLAIKAPFDILQTNENSMKLEQIDIFVKVNGGGLVGQAEAIKLGVARAICQVDTSEETLLRKSLKDRGYLTQDSRVKERRKYGLKKARKAPQYNKR